MHACDHQADGTTQTLDETLFTARHSLHHAAANDQLGRASLILARSKTEIRERDTAGYEAVLYVRSCAMLKLLDAAGADLAVVTPAGRRSLLHRTVVLGGDDAVDMIRLLLERGITDREDADGITALQLAQTHGKAQLVDLLSSHKHATT